MQSTMDTTGASGAAERDMADLAACHALVGCLTREVAGPDGQLTHAADGSLLVRLPHTGHLLRVRLARFGSVGVHRFTGPVRRLRAGDWAALDATGLARLVAEELRLRGGVDNPEFVAQVAGSRDALARVLVRRPAADPYPPADPALATYLASEHALVHGHPRHPAPKWRDGDAADWDAHAPELRTAFRPHWLAVPQALLDEDSVDGGGFDVHSHLPGPPGRPAGTAAVPVHPWQWRLVRRAGIAPAVTAALAGGILTDLGEHGPLLRPTASVRTLYDPDRDVFLKTSLHVRITNCVRKNAWYELPAAVALTRLLARITADAPGHPERFAVLPEPAYRTVRLGTGAAEALGVIVRGGLRPYLRPGDTPILAAALATTDPLTGAAARVPAGALADWWHAYLRLLLPPVLWLFAEHGVVTEPHLQNVVVVLDAGGWPARVLLRDLEGTKLHADRHAGTLATWPRRIAESVAYDPVRGWRRVAYCLFVNHLAELAAALADLSAAGGTERELWAVAREVVADCAARLGSPPPLRALLAGVPLPAKANLLVRWARAGDREAGYVPFPNPFGPPPERVG